VYKQIEQALEKMDSSNKETRERMSTILKRYAADEIGLDEAFYDLLEEELIPMPQRCGMSAKIPLAAEDETRLKEKIRSRLFRK
jgi:signal transduction histidine kinase